MKDVAAIQRLLARFRPVSIRHRLLIAFLLIVLIPAVAFGAVSAWIGIRNGHQQVTDQLTSVAVLKEAEIDTWSRSIESDLSTVFLIGGTNDHLRILLSSPEDSAAFQQAHSFMYDRLRTLLNETQRLDEVFVVNLERRVVLSTDREHEASLGSVVSSVGSRSYLILQEGLRGDHGDLTALTRLYQDFVVLVVRSIHDERGELLGLVVGYAGSDRLSEIMLERAGLGETGETYLVHQNGVILTKSRYQAGLSSATYSVSSAGSRPAVYDHVNGAGVYRNYHDERVIGVYRWLPELETALVAEQSEREAMRPVYQMVTINLGVALAVALVASLISLSLARTIVRPLDSLAHTVTRVTNGEFGLASPVEREDEIGSLARAFNAMTSRLQELISSLDQRVRERTQMLHRRALQLETSIRVGHEITSILAMEDLLSRVVNLIADAFDYYHVGIYLLDQDNDQLVFRAGAGTVSRPGLAETGPLAVGPGTLNGEAAASNQAIMVDDVAQDHRFHAHDNLPETRSELVVPLRVGEQVIGTLDVQSSNADDFGEDDARIIQGLGDQVAVAIENARLYSRSRALAVVDERNRLARELHDAITQSLYGLVAFAGGGRELVQAGNLAPVEGQFNRIEQVAQQALKEMRLMLYELRPLALEHQGLSGALRERLDVVERRAGVSTRLLVDETIELSPDEERDLYRIAQEALNNALKHSAASAVNVTLRREGDWIELEVADDGVGFDVDRVWKSPGLGLTGMQERAEELGGSLILESAPGEGTRARVRVRRPIPVATADR
jgi:nitrate/nitrite-specific signal transduction histidine kinase